MSVKINKNGKAKQAFIALKMGCLQCVVYFYLLIFELNMYKFTEYENF